MHPCPRCRVRKQLLARRAKKRSIAAKQQAEQDLRRILGAMNALTDTHDLTAIVRDKWGDGDWSIMLDDGLITVNVDVRDVESIVGMLNAVDRMLLPQQKPTHGYTNNATRELMKKIDNIVHANERERQHRSEERERARKVDGT
jgi:hypothetical protein